MFYMSIDHTFLIIFLFSFIQIRLQINIDTHVSFLSICYFSNKIVFFHSSLCLFFINFIILIYFDIDMICQIWAFYSYFFFHLHSYRWFLYKSVIIIFHSWFICVHNKVHLLHGLTFVDLFKHFLPCLQHRRRLPNQVLHP